MGFDAIYSAYFYLYNTKTLTKIWYMENAMDLWGSLQRPPRNRDCDDASIVYDGLFWTPTGTFVTLSCNFPMIRAVFIILLHFIKNFVS